ncbi:hypothetical protein ABT026_12455 [Streptomyces sp. NPDC002734]|uniref:hypothetical protein n=1 Tax=Streptomyces sp. NPDC002734 TaxID=3154426 RepID=UPI0033331DF3
MKTLIGNPDDSSDSEDPELARIRRLLMQFDSRETPLEQSEFLEQLGKTRPVIDHYRRYVARADRQAVARKMAGEAPQEPDVPLDGSGPEHKAPRLRPQRALGPRTRSVSGPPNRDDRNRRRFRTPEDGAL